MSKIDSVQASLGVKFKDPKLIELALIHDSYVNENPTLAPSSNERLEFLGDAILGMVVAEKLYNDFPEYSEGLLTHARAALVRRETLARMARRLKLGDHLYLGRGEGSSGGKDKVPNLAGVVEAVIGAVFLDQGIRAAKAVALRMIKEEYDTLVNAGVSTDVKSELQELIQAKTQTTPTYHVVSSSGPDHDRTFQVEVREDERVLGRGKGKNKKSAENAAAQDALRRQAN